MKTKILNRFYITLIAFIFMLRAVRLEDDTLDGYLNKYPVEWYHYEVIILFIVFTITLLFLCKELIRDEKNINK